LIHIDDFFTEHFVVEVRIEKRMHGIIYCSKRDKCILAPWCEILNHYSCLETSSCNLKKCLVGKQNIKCWLFKCMKRHWIRHWLAYCSFYFQWFCIYSFYYVLLALINYSFCHKCVTLI